MVGVTSANGLHIMGTSSSWLFLCVCESVGFFSFCLCFSFFGVYLGERTQGRDGNKGLGDFSWKNGAWTGFSMIKMSSDDYWYEDKM